MFWVWLLGVPLFAIGTAHILAEDNLWVEKKRALGFWKIVGVSVAVGVFWPVVVGFRFVRLVFS